MLSFGWLWLASLVSVAPAGALPVVLEGFEAPTQLRLGGEQVQPQSQLRLSAQQPLEGKRCAELRYRFERVEGLQFLEVIAPHRLRAKGHRLSVSVRGDGSGNFVRVRFVDSKGEWHQWDLGKLDFRGWRVLSANLDAPHGFWHGDGNGQLDYPITFYSIVLDSSVRPSEGVVAFDAVTVEAEGRAEYFVEARFEPARQWGYFWGKGDVPSGRLVFTSGAKEPATVAVTLRVLDYQEMSVMELQHPAVTVAYGKPFECPIQLQVNRFGVYFVEVRVGEEVRHQSICWLPEPAPFWDHSPFGVQTHFGQFKHKVPDTLKLIKRMGAAWVRDELYWSTVEREKGKFVFPDYYDTYMQAAANSGIRPFIIFDYGNEHYDGGVAPHTPEGISAFVRYCRQLINRYGKICHHWEVWNEPNIGFWQPEPNPKHYTNLLKAVYQAVKAADPKAIVVGVCTAGTDFHFIEEVLKLGGGNFMDALSVHPYRYPRSPEESDFVGEMQKLKALLDKYSVGHLKVWLTEFGYPTHITQGGVPQHRSAAMIVRTCLWALSLPFVERLFVYDFQDDGDDPNYNEANFGLIRLDSSPKVGYAAFNTMARMLHRKRFVRPLDVGEGMFCLEFADGKDGVLATWVAKGAGTLALKVKAKSVTVTDLMGNSETMHAIDGRINLPVTEEPMFITGYSERSSAAISR